MDILHELIHTMTASEKGYFKKYPTGNGGEYIRLFDAIAAMKVYDEDKLVARLGKASTVRHLSRAKNYLYESLIRNLLLYHEQSTPKIRAHILLNEAAMLHNRGLPYQAKKRLEKAKVIAREGEWFTIWLDTLHHQRQLCNLRIYQPDELDADTIMAEINMVIKQLENIYAYHALGQEQDRILKSSILLRKEEIKEKLEEIKNHPLLRDESEALSLTGKITYNHTHYFNAVLRQDYATAYTFARRHLELIAASKEMQEARPTIIFDAYNIILTAAQFMKESAAMSKYLTGLKELPVRNTYQEIVKFQYYSGFALQHYVNERNEKEFVRSAQEIAAKLKLYHRAIKEDMRISILLAISDGYTRFGRYEEAIDTIEGYRQKPPKDIRQDYQNFLLFFYLIAQHELGNKQLVQNLLTNVERFMKRVKEFSPIDHLCLRVFSVINDVPDKRTRNIELGKISAELDKMVQDSGRNWRNYQLILSPFIHSQMRGIKYHEAQVPRENSRLNHH